MARQAQKPGKRSEGRKVRSEGREVRSERREGAGRIFSLSASHFSLLYPHS